MDFLWALGSITWGDVLDILIVALIFFIITFFIRGTQALTLLRGMLLVLAVVVLISSQLRLLAVQWLLSNVLTVLAVAIPVIFQPELRRALERLGRAGVFVNRRPVEDVRAKLIEDIALAAERLSERRHGALVVLERSTALGDYIRTGVSLNADSSPQLFLTIFWPKTELHDGAAIIGSDGRVAAASCVLPLTSARSQGVNTAGTPKLGTRHRAAIGITEVSDAVVVVVSEETGRISIANGGRLIMRLDGKRLRTILTALYGGERNTAPTLVGRVREWWAGLTSVRQPQR